MITATFDSGNLLLDFDKFNKKLEKQIDKDVRSWYEDLVASTPVLSGKMKRSWSPIAHPKGSMWWLMINTSDHAKVIARARRRLPNQNGVIRWYGSTKNGWGGGITPFLKKLEWSIIKNAEHISN